MLTAHDLHASMLSYLGGNNDNQSVVQARQSINDALDEVASKHNWPHYASQGVLNTDAPYETGLITYVASTRLITLAGGTWPTWAEYGTIFIGGKYARVTDRVSGTVIEIEQTNLTDDIATGTDYRLYRNEYPLSDLVHKISYLAEDSNQWTVAYQHPMEFATYRMGSVESNMPTRFTIREDRNVLGGKAIVLWPCPSAALTYRYPYYRKPRAVTVWEKSDGKVEVVAASNAVTGTQTLFDQACVGALIRISNTSAVPTNSIGTNPAADERVILAVGGATALTTTTNFAVSASNVKCMISSILDVDRSMELILRYQSLLELGRIRNFEPKAMQQLGISMSDALENAKSKVVTQMQITYAGVGNSPADTCFFVV